MNSYSCARDGPIALYRIATRGSSKTATSIPGELQSNIRRNHGIRDVWLLNSVFSGFFRLFERKPLSIGFSAKEAYFNSIFLSRACDSKRKK